MTWEQREQAQAQELAEFYAQRVKDPGWRDYVKDRMATLGKRWPEVRELALSSFRGHPKTSAPTPGNTGQL